MAVQRNKCTDCDNMILPEIAARNSGLCGQCTNVPESSRRKKREFDQTVALGLLFTPTEQERQSAKRPAELEIPGAVWELEREFYKNSEWQSVRDVIAHASKQPAGDVFLVSETGARLNLSFNKEFGVCEYHNEKSAHYLYAFTPKNLREQIRKELHLVQACPCCGVGMLWFPSRFHMPRKMAFEVFSALALGAGSDTSDVEWLDCGDISYTSPGHG